MIIIFLIVEIRYFSGAGNPVVRPKIAVYKIIIVTFLVSVLEYKLAGFNRGKRNFRFCLSPISDRNLGNRQKLDTATQECNSEEPKIFAHN